MVFAAEYANFYWFSQDNFSRDIYIFLGKHSLINIAFLLYIKIAIQYLFYITSLVSRRTKLKGSPQLIEDVARAKRKSVESKTTMKPLLRPYDVTPENSFSARTFCTREAITSKRVQCRQDNAEGSLWTSARE